MKITLATAAALTGLSDRTLRRWIVERTIRREEGPRTMIDLTELLPHIQLPVDDDARALIHAADRGDADAQNGLALLFLAGRLYGRAFPWLTRAAAQGHADAMSWLARCHFEGRGTPQDGSLGMMWLAKAAATGHAISARQLASLVRVPLPQG